MEEEVEVPGLRFADRRLRFQVDGLLAGHGLVHAGAALHAQAAAGAILGRHLHGELLAGIFLAFGIRAFERGRRLGQHGGIVGLHADGRVRADQRALRALDADGGVPDRDLGRDVAFLVLRGGGRPGAVHGHGADRDGIALLRHDLRRDILDERRGVGRDHGRHLQLAGWLGRDLYGAHGIGCGVDGVPVLLHHGVALPAVGLLGSLLEGVDGLGLRQDAGDLEEGRLHKGVDAAAQVQLMVELERVDHIELQLLGDDLPRDLVRNVVPDIVRLERRGQQEDRAVLGLREHVVLLEERKIVARHEIDLGAEVRAADEPRTEAQM